MWSERAYKCDYIDTYARIRGNHGVLSTIPSLALSIKNEANRKERKNTQNIASKRWMKWMKRNPHVLWNPKKSNAFHNAGIKVSNMFEVKCYRICQHYSPNKRMIIVIGLLCTAFMAWLPAMMMIMLNDFYQWHFVTILQCVEHVIALALPNILWRHIDDYDRS